MTWIEFGPLRPLSVDVLSHPLTLVCANFSIVVAWTHKNKFKTNRQKACTVGDTAIKRRCKWVHQKYVKIVSFGCE